MELSEKMQGSGSKRDTVLENTGEIQSFIPQLTLTLERTESTPTLKKASEKVYMRPKGCSVA